MAYFWGLAGEVFNVRTGPCSMAYTESVVMQEVIEMLMKLRSNGALIEIQNVSELWDPYARKVLARVQRGEEQQDCERFAKQDLCFLSGECLPTCWRDPHYRDYEVEHHRVEPGQILGASCYFGA